MKNLYHIASQEDADKVQSVIVGSDRDNDIGLFIETQEDQHITLPPLDISNVFIPIIKIGDGELVIDGDLEIHDFGGDAINLRGYLFEVAGLYHTYDNTPTRPYNRCYRKGAESIAECLARNGEIVYDYNLLNLARKGGRQFIEGYHQDCIMQAYAVKADGYTVDNNGLTGGVTIKSLHAEITGKKAQGVIFSEKCDAADVEIGTDYLKIEAEHPHPFMFNTVRNLNIGNKKAIGDGSVRVIKVKPSKFSSKNLNVEGLTLITDMENNVGEYINEDSIKKTEKVKNMFDPMQKYPNLVKNESIPRGIRNNNAGNIKDFGIKWKGLANKNDRLSYQRGEDVMCVFVHPKWGIRAIIHDLQTKQRKYSDCRSIRGILERYAPKGNENPALEEYIFFVSRHVGVDHRQTISVKDYKIAKKIVTAIMLFENERVVPYDDDIIEEGLLLGGITLPDESKATGVKSTSKSKGIRNGIIVGGASATGIGTKIADVIDKSKASSDIVDATGETATTIAYSPILITYFDWIQLGLLVFIALVALDWVLDRRLTNALGIK